MAGQENSEGNNEQQQEMQTQSNVSSTAVEASAAAAVPPTSSATEHQQQRTITNAHKGDYERDLVYLYQFCRCGISPSVSPFCLKVETWLRIAGIKYENVDHKMKLRSKKGQLPFVEVNGVEIADSAVIIRELGKQFNKDLDAGLSREQRIMSHALTAMVDHHTSWIYRWWRYSNVGEFLKEAKMNFQQARQTKIPAPLLNFIIKLKFKGKKKAAIGHGIGVHKPEEIYEFGERDLEVLNESLGDKSYFFGEQPRVLDCVVFCHLVQFLHGQGDKFPPKVFLEEKCPQLVAYVERIKDKYWPDWEEMCNTRDLNTHLPKPAAPVAAATPPAKSNRDGDDKKEEDKEKDKEKDDDGGEKEKLDGNEKELEKKLEEVKQDANKLEEKSNEGDKADKEK